MNTGTWSRSGAGVADTCDNHVVFVSPHGCGKNRMTARLLCDQCGARERIGRSAERLFDGAGGRRELGPQRQVGSPKLIDSRKEKPAL
jgi:hypothetical protein